MEKIVIYPYIYYILIFDRCMNGIKPVEPHQSKNTLKLHIFTFITAYYTVNFNQYIKYGLTSKYNCNIAFLKNWKEMETSHINQITTYTCICKNSWFTVVKRITCSI